MHAWKNHQRKRYGQAIVVCSLLAIVSVMLLSEVSSAYAQSSEAEFLRDQISNARSFAEKQRRHAQQWQDRADRARQRAGQSKNKVDRDSYIEDARLYDQRAVSARDNAAQAAAEATEAEVELSQVLAALADRPGTDSPNTDASNTSANNVDEEALPAIPLEQVLGVWRVIELDSPFVIVQQDPEFEAYPYKLEAHTDQRIWKGEYNPYDSDDIRSTQNSRLVFKYKPKAEEMNPEIPEWARKKIEGELEWQLELSDAGSCGSPALTGYFFPGEVKWNKDEVDGPVKIIDRGKPRELDLEHIGQYEFDLVSRPVLHVHLGNQQVEHQRNEKQAKQLETGEYDPFIDPIEGLTKRQRFFIQVSLPQEIAEQQGASLEVSVKGLISGTSDSIRLTAGAIRQGHAVNYTNREAVTIADGNDGREQDRDAEFGSWSWWTNSSTGARLDIEVENAEPVEFRFGNVFETIPIYSSWVQRNIARYAAAAARLHIAYESIHEGAGSGISLQHREEAEKRLRMLDNMRTMLDSGYLSDIHKHELLSLYIAEDSGIVFEELKTLDLREREIITAPWYIEKYRSTGSGLFKTFVEGLTGKDLSSKVPESYRNIQWVSSGEGFFAREQLRDASESIQTQAFETLPKALAYGLYDGIVSSTSAGDLYLIGTSFSKDGPSDHFGNRRTAFDVAMASVGFVSNSVLHFSQPIAWQRFINRDISIGRAPPIKRRMKRLGTPVETPQALYGSFEPSSYPDSLKPEQVAQINLKPNRADTTNTGGKSTGQIGEDIPVSCVNLSKSDVAPELDLNIDNELMLSDIDNLKEFYGSKPKFVDPFSDPIFPQQKHQTCNAQSFYYSHYKKTGEIIGEMHGYGRAVRTGILKQSDLGQNRNPLIHGFTQQQVRDIAALHQVDSFEIPAAKNGSVSLADIDALRREFDFEVKLILATNDGPHAIMLHKFRRDTTGAITDVEFFDPAFGRIAEMSACMFRNRMLKGPRSGYGGITFFSWADPSVQFQRD